MKRGILFILLIISTLVLIDRASAPYAPRSSAEVWEAVSHATPVHPLPTATITDDGSDLLTPYIRESQPAPSRSAVRSHSRHQYYRTEPRPVTLLMRPGATHISLQSDRSTPHAVLRSADYYVLALRRLLI